jgi:hypothetical protein
MKHLAAIAFLLMVLTSKAQTVTSIADGLWDDPATWDCGCVPAAPAVVNVLHHVSSTQVTMFDLSIELHVLAGGLLDLSSHSFVQGQGATIKTVDVGGEMIVSIAGLTNAIINGSLTGSGEIYLYGGVTIGGVVSATNVRCYSGDIVLNNGSVHASGAFNMSGLLGALSGAGQICASDSLALSYCTVSGTIDLCDLSPTVTVPPFVDWCDNCTVASTVTYCSGSSCLASVQDLSSSATLAVYPNPAHDQVNFEGMPTGAELRIYDGLGQLVRAPRMALGTRTTMDLGSLPKGIYLATATKGMLRLSTRLVVE